MEKILADYTWAVILVLILTLPWKGAALWISARRGHVGWFLVLLILNTLAIVDILYIFIFSKWGAVKTDHQDEVQQQEETEVVRQPRFSSNSNNRTMVL